MRVHVATETELTQLLSQAFEQASNLPAAQQDAVARWLLAEMEDEERWSRSLGASPEKLARLANEALREHRAGRTRKLDPERP
jgi:hypothetical protein